MRNKIVKIIGLLLIIAQVGSSTAFASELQIGNVQTGQTIEPRSLYLAAAISEISNEGNGILYIYADFTSNRSVEWAQLKITVERSKTGEDGTWSNPKTFTYEFKKEEQPDNRLTYAYAEFETDEFTPGYYYRLTCTHKVKTPSGSYESKTTRTDGVLLTAYPDFRVVDQEN